MKKLLIALRLLICCALPIDLHRSAGGTEALLGPGSIDPLFRPDIIGSVINDLSFDGNGMIIACGSVFGPGDRSTVAGLLRISRNGVLDPSFNRDSAQRYDLLYLSAMSRQGQGWFAAGAKKLFSVDSVGNNQLILEADASISVLVSDASGRVLVGGSFSILGNFARKRIARILSNGSVDPAFSTGRGVSGPSGVRVTAIAVQSDGKILIGGEFETYQDYPRRRIARLHPNGDIDLSFDPGSGIGAPAISGFDYPAISTLAIDPAGNILIGGGFKEALGVPRTNFVRLAASGALADRTTPSPNRQVRSIVLDRQGRVLLGGEFSQVNGLPRIGFVRLFSDLSIDPMFRIRTNAFIGIRKILISEDDSIFVGGNNYQSSFLARLSSSAAPQEIHVQPSSTNVIFRLDGIRGTVGLEQSSNLLTWTQITSTQMLVSPLFLTNASLGQGNSFFRTSWEDLP